MIRAVELPMGNERPLAGRTALVTGAARRIGRAIALGLARAGADVTITFQHSRAEAEATVEEIASLGVAGIAVACDLHQPEAIAEAVGETVRRSGGELDILVNNAGSFEVAALEEIDPAQWDRMFATNTRAPMLVAQAALPYLRRSEHTGRIVNIGSLGGMRPWATHGHYCASKAALHMLTQTMARAWAPEIAVNCIAPGMIVTGSEPDEDYAHFAAKTPMKRNGKPADVAELAVYLASCTPFLTGQVIAIDGGLGL